ncbi:MAG: hypothetical protein JJE25_04610 [Bacteroidia bacterium]|nr:hypothetical protein [Bacteroidia bacterium]
MKRTVRQKYMNLDLKLEAMVTDMQREKKVRDDLERDSLLMNYNLMTRCMVFLELEKQNSGLHADLSKDVMHLTDLSEKVAGYLDKLKDWQENTYTLDEDISRLILKLNDKAVLVEERKLSENELAKELDDFDREAGAYRNKQLQYFSKMDELQKELDALKTNTQYDVN